MKLSVCHYSFHRRWKEESWTLERLCEEAKSLGVKGPSVFTAVSLLWYNLY
jgi:hypothetical protein